MVVRDEHQGIEEALDDLQVEVEGLDLSETCAQIVGSNFGMASATRNRLRSEQSPVQLRALVEQNQVLRQTLAVELTWRSDSCWTCPVEP